MAFEISGYVDPGTYAHEVVSPQGGNIPTQPFAPCLIGIGSPTKRVTNESVVRGRVSAEVLSSLAATPGAHTFSALTYKSNRQKSQTTIKRYTNSGVATTLSSADWNYEKAFVPGVAGPVTTLVTGNAFSLAIDGKQPIQVRLLSLASGRFSLVPSGSATILASPGTGYVQPAAATKVTITTAGVTVTDTTSAVTISGLLADGTADSEVVSLTGSTTVTSTKAYQRIDSIIGTKALTGGTVSIGGLANLDVVDGGSLVDVYVTSFTSLSRADLAAIVNSALAGSAIYGAAYNTCASDHTATSLLRLTGLTSGAASDARVFRDVTNSAGCLRIWGDTLVEATSIVSITDTAYAAGASAASWTIAYSTGDLTVTDTLANTATAGIIRCGSRRNTANYTENLDFTELAGVINWNQNVGPLTKTWSGLTTLDATTNYLLKLSLDSKPSITINVASAAVQPLGYTPSTSPSMTLSDVADNINAVLAASAVYGPDYRAVASGVDGVSFTLTSPSSGRAGNISLFALGSNDALQSLTGDAAGQSVSNSTLGFPPVAGTAYFVSYDMDRDDFNTLQFFTSLSDAMAAIGPLTPDNELAMATEMAFKGGADIVYVVQVEAQGAVQSSVVQAALDEVVTSPNATDIVPIGQCIVSNGALRDDIVQSVIDLVEAQGSPEEGAPRRAWFSHPADMPIGEEGTPDTLRDTAITTLQVSANSPARGRLYFIVLPQGSGVTRNFLFDSGAQTVPIDGSFVAAAAAARRCKLDPWDTLTNKNLSVGINTDDITAPWSQAERRLLAGAGCMVLTFVGGAFKFLDAMTTEGGGGNLDAFKIDGSSYAKDIITKGVIRAINENLIGTVPYDLASFILSVKLVVQGVLAGGIASGTIGPFREDDDITPRPIDLRKDIIVQQSTTSKTSWLVRYYFNLRYPALRVFVEYSVDTPAATLL